jgi:hypothetical protein
MTNLEEFEIKYPLQEIYYKGQIKFEKYTRFMLIGVKGTTTHSLPNETGRKQLTEGQRWK